MTEEFNNNNLSQQAPQEPTTPVKNKQSRSLLVIFVIFIALVTMVLLTQKKESINWIKDYNLGIELAKKQNKPILLAFYKPNTPMCTDTFNDTYKNPKVKEFVETNFIPILINVDENPEIARLYKVDYYPTHYIKSLNSDKLLGPRFGYDPPGLFINVINEFLEEMKKSER